MPMAINNDKALKTCMGTPPNITGLPSKLSNKCISCIKIFKLAFEGQLAPESIRYNGTQMAHPIEWKESSCKDNLRHVQQSASDW